MAVSTKSEMTSTKFFAEEYLFQTIKIDIELITKIIVQANTIIEFEGVQSGILIVLYHFIPTSAK